MRSSRSDSDMWRVQSSLAIASHRPLQLNDNTVLL